MEKTKKPSAREFQYEKPMCLVERMDCLDSFEPIDVNGRKHNCSNCELAFEHKNKKEQTTTKSE